MRELAERCRGDDGRGGAGDEADGAADVGGGRWRWWKLIAGAAEADVAVAKVGDGDLAIWEAARGLADGRGGDGKVQNEVG